MGRSTVMCRSNRPAEQCGSRMSGRLVAAMTITDSAGESVHFAEDLVERLLALVVAAAQARPAVPAHRVDLVDKEDRRGVLLGVPNRSRHGWRPPHEHLDKLRPADRKERHPGLARHRASEQRLAGAGRAHEQDPLGHTAAKLAEFGRILEELDHFLQLVLDPLQPGHVVEGYPIVPAS